MNDHDRVEKCEDSNQLLGHWYANWVSSETHELGVQPDLVLWHKGASHKIRTVTVLLDSSDLSDLYAIQIETQYKPLFKK